MKNGHVSQRRQWSKRIPKRLLQGVVLPAATLVFVTACSRDGESDTATPTPPPAFTIVTPTPIPPGATVVITPTPTIDISTLEKYTVKDGDSLSSIADEFGVSQEALAEINNIDDPNSLFAGQEIVIPPK